MDDPLREYINKNGNFLQETRNLFVLYVQNLEIDEGSFEGVVKNLQMGVNVIEIKE